MLVLLESPYSGDIDRNVEYARKCMKDCLIRGEYPFASHLLYTQPGILDDTNANDRELGITAGLCWGSKADKTVVYVDFGISPGMKCGIKQAILENRPIVYRKLNNQFK